MPLITTILDDQVPLLQYDNSWSAGSSRSDNNASFYYLGTFSTCTQQGGTVSFSFNGTGFGIYGAKRPYHGEYAVTVDGTQVYQQSGSEPENEEQYQQMLYASTTLSQASHAVSLSNAGGGYVDIDFVTIQSQIGENNQTIQTSIIQDTDPRFSYQGEDWNRNPANISMFNNGTGHSAMMEGSSAMLSFTGDAVSLYGSVGPNNGYYTAQLDERPAIQYNATRQLLLTQVMLYRADNLGPGEHQLTLTNLPETSGQTLDIDYAEIMTLSSINSTANQNPVVYASASSISRGGIAGLVVLGITTLLFALSNLYLYRRLRISHAEQADMYASYAGRPMTQYEAAASQAFTSGGATDRSDHPSSSQPVPSSQFDRFSRESLHDVVSPPSTLTSPDRRPRNSVAPTVTSSLPDYAQAISRQGRQ